MIICAAIKVVGKCDNIGLELEAPRELVVCGLRHGNCYEILRELKDGWLKHCVKIEGFITDEGKFLSRRSAFIHACQCGQLSQTTKWYKQDNNIGELESEDLY